MEWTPLSALWWWRWWRSNSRR